MEEEADALCDVILRKDVHQHFLGEVLGGQEPPDRADGARGVLMGPLARGARGSPGDVGKVYDRQKCGAPGTRFLALRLAAASRRRGVVEGFGGVLRARQRACGARAGHRRLKKRMPISSAILEIQGGREADFLCHLRNQGGRVTDPDF